MALPGALEQENVIAGISSYSRGLSGTWEALLRGSAREHLAARYRTLDACSNDRSDRMSLILGLGPGVDTDEFASDQGVKISGGPCNASGGPAPVLAVVHWYA